MKSPVGSGHESNEDTVHLADSMILNTKDEETFWKSSKN